VPAQKLTDCMVERSEFELPVPVCERFIRQHQVKLCDIETKLQSALRVALAKEKMFAA
jgi:hypothetical protein